MIWFLLALVSLAVLAPLAGADTRDSLDWRHDDLSPHEGALRPTAGRERATAHRTSPTAC